MKSIKFENVAMFSDWKARIEGESKTDFVRHRGSKCQDDVETTYYYCGRSGPQKKLSGRDSIRMTTSRKMGKHCTAHMVVSKFNLTGEVCVTYCDTHYSHEVEVGQLRLREEDKKAIASRLDAGVGHDAVLKQIRHTLTDDGFDRIHLTTRQDIANIAREFGVGG